MANFYRLGAYVLLVLTACMLWAPKAHAYPATTGGFEYRANTLAFPTGAQACADGIATHNATAGFTSWVFGEFYNDGLCLGAVYNSNGTINNPDTLLMNVTKTPAGAQCLSGGTLQGSNCLCPTFFTDTG
ncbi:MAG: hypothetical protein JWQ72_1902, partial [Polaromonas sp.]|nr:hypothetical protein [Polaromonas sp.]